MDRAWALAEAGEEAERCVPPCWAWEAEEVVGFPRWEVAEEEDRSRLVAAGSPAEAEAVGEPQDRTESVVAQRAPERVVVVPAVVPAEAAVEVEEEVVVGVVRADASAAQSGQPTAMRRGSALGEARQRSLKSKRLDRLCCCNRVAERTASWSR